MKEYVLHSMKLGPSPPRALWRVSTAAAYTAVQSCPSTRSDGIPYPRPRMARSATASPREAGTEME